MRQLFERGIWEKTVVSLKRNETNLLLCLQCDPVLPSNSFPEGEATVPCVQCFAVRSCLWFVMLTFFLRACVVHEATAEGTEKRCRDEVVRDFAGRVQHICMGRFVTSSTTVACICIGRQHAWSLSAPRMCIMPVCRGRIGTTRVIWACCYVAK